MNDELRLLIQSNAQIFPACIYCNSPVFPEQLYLSSTFSQDLIFFWTPQKLAVLALDEVVQLDEIA